MTKIFLALALLLAVKEQPITVTARPSICMAPCSVMLLVKIPQQIDNRWAVVEIDGPLLRSSSIQLNGEDAAKFYELRYKDLPAGVYEIKAILYNTTKEIGRHVIPLIVQGN